MKSNKAIKVRLYPNKDQEILLAKTFGCCRFVYNTLLSEQDRRYKNKEKHLSKFKGRDYIFQQVKKEHEFLNEVDSLALMNSCFAMNEAYTRFFKKQAKFPKYKSKHRSKKSYTTSFVNNNISVVDKTHIKLPKLGTVKAKVHKVPNADWIIKSATVSQDSDGKYYCSLLFEFTRPEISIPVDVISDDKVLGLDYKASELYVDSNKNHCGMDKYYKKSHDRLAKAQRKLKNKVGNKKHETKSNNYKKQQKKINKIYCKIKNQRKDFLHKQSRKIANSYDVVCIEDISIKEQLQDRPYKNFRKSTLDNGWYNFTVYLGYKLNDKGGYLVKIDKSYPSSQICSCCGYVNEELKDDKIRKWTCPNCGSKHDRDENSAVNIKQEGLRILKEVS